MNSRAQSQADASLFAATTRLVRGMHALGSPRLLAALVLLTACNRAAADSAPGSAEFRAHIRPILENYCFDCHGDGAHKGNVAFDELKSDQAILGNPDCGGKH
jgi:mono/diheme cytochrome c family protein